MAEVKSKHNIKNKGPSKKFSLFTFADDPTKSLPSSIKSPKNFGEPNGVAGLGILAAMNNNDKCHYQDPLFKKAAILAISPRSLSNPIPVFCNKRCTSLYANSNANANGNIGKRPSVDNMQLCEEYTCVISHVGDNQIKKTEYFDDGGFLENTNVLVTGSVKITENGNFGYWENPGAVPAYSAVNQGGGLSAFQIAEFLSSCFLCKKQLDGIDIFMYRGEKAFCSADCRHEQISIDEHKEKCVSGSMKPLEYSASPCSDQMRFLAGFAVA